MRDLKKFKEYFGKFLEGKLPDDERDAFIGFFKTDQYKDTMKNDEG